MKAAIRRVLTLWLQTPEGTDALRHIADLKGNKGWQAYQNLILFLRSNIRETPLSKEFDALNTEDKKALLKALRWMDEFLGCAMNPTSVIESTSAIKAHNEKIMQFVGKPRPGAKAKKL